MRNGVWIIHPPDDEFFPPEMHTEYNKNYHRVEWWDFDEEGAPPYKGVQTFDSYSDALYELDRIWNKMAAQEEQEALFEEVKGWQPDPHPVEYD